MMDHGPSLVLNKTDCCLNKEKNPDYSIDTHERKRDKVGSKVLEGYSR